jgi:hypothetical protein
MAIDPPVCARVFLAGLVCSARAARRRSDRGAVVALIAVHDEEEHVEVAIRSLKEQESSPNVGGVFSALKEDILASGRWENAQPTAAAAVRTANVRSGTRAGAAGSTTAG